jgi:putative restriction endonuclease
MKISEFFTDTLGANLRNQRWSWGAVNPITNRVFLRVWEDSIQIKKDRVHLLDEVTQQRLSSRGFAERHRHLDLILKGAEGFGVVCTAVNPHTHKERRIKNFDDKRLLRFGTLVMERGSTYAKIDGYIPVSDLAQQRTAESTLSDDLRALIKQNITSTIKEELINARIGQGIFRTKALKLWGGRCAVTNSKTLDAIRASHIKPWRSSTDKERLDPNNGLPLIASLDALFDAGLISFDESGKLIVSSMLQVKERHIFGIDNASLNRMPPQKTLEYLTYHRNHIFRK